MSFSRRGGRPPARQPRREPGVPRRGGEKSRPMPLPDGKCNPLCPYFRCLNNSLTVVRKPVHGKMQRVAYCRWIGDECIGGACQYAACALKALLPDGTCLYAKEKQTQETRIEDLEREIRAEEEAMSKIEKLMKRKGYFGDDEFE